jgi:hypothetical protein
MSSRGATPHYLRLSFDACGMLQDGPDLSAAAGTLASKPVIN